jgi:hypothetical protein
LFRSTNLPMVMGAVKDDEGGRQRLIPRLSEQASWGLLGLVRHKGQILIQSGGPIQGGTEASGRRVPARARPVFFGGRDAWIGRRRLDGRAWDKPASSTPAIAAAPCGHRDWQPHSERLQASLARGFPQPCRARRPAYHPIIYPSCPSLLQLFRTLHVQIGRNKGGRHKSQIR